MDSLKMLSRHILISKSKNSMTKAESHKC